MGSPVRLEPYPFIERRAIHPQRRSLLLPEVLGAVFLLHILISGAHAQANTWTRMTPQGSSPPALREHAMVYDRLRNRIVIAGGANQETGVLFTETWAYDLAANRWTNLNTVSTYLPSREPGMAIDPSTGRIVMFGGSDINYSMANHDQTWIYDPAANNWARVLPPTGSPPPRGAAPGMAFDLATNVVVMYGGIGACRPDTPFCADVWEFRFSNNTWTLITDNAPPGGRDHNQFAFNQGAGVFVLFGGHGDFPGTYANDTWTYDHATRTWRSLGPTGQIPEARDHGKLAYAGSGRVLLFGGRCFGCDSPLPGTWIHDISSNTWTNMNPLNPPSPRMDHAMAYHENAEQVVVFGGGNNETWTYRFGEPPPQDTIAPVNPGSLRVFP